MRPARAAHRDATIVTIVSDNAETLDGLETYLQRAGVATRSTRDIARAVDLTEMVSAAVVIFPDDFAPDAVADAVANLGAKRPKTLVVLVTCAPKRFAKASPPLGATTLVVSRPAWGWTILDAIREHLAGKRTL
jgi:DNA-binding NtrC family response regulator